MAEVVLDASAVLAALKGEPGAEAVEAVVGRALLGAVNLAEVVGKLTDFGLDEVQAQSAVAALGCEIVAFDADLAVRTGLFRRLTHRQGLSLGDRACLALAERESLEVLTTDRAWSQLNVPINIRVLR